MSKYILILSMFFIYCSSNNRSNNQIISNEKNPIFLLDKKGICVVIEDSIIKYAESKFIEIYGDVVLNKKPFTVTLDSNDVFLISGTPEYKESKVFPGVNSILGGVPYMRVLKSNCQIIQISHTK